MAAPKQTDPQFKLRLTPEIKANVEEAAKKNARSMNAEILYRLGNWDDVVEQVDLTHEGWEGSRNEVDRLQKALDAALDEKHRMRQLGWDKANAGPSQAEVEAGRVMQLALDTLEASVADQRRNLIHDRYMLSQIRLMRGLLDRVAASDGVVPNDLLAMIRILTDEGRGVDPRDPDVARLLGEAVHAIEMLDEQEGE